MLTHHHRKQHAPWGSSLTSHGSTFTRASVLPLCVSNKDTALRIRWIISRWCALQWDKYDITKVQPELRPMSNSPFYHDCPLQVEHIPSTTGRHTLCEDGDLISSTQSGLDIRLRSPSISTCRPIVFFQFFPARAMRRNRLSPSRGICCLRGRCCTVEFTTASASGVPPEKKAWMLYISA